MQVSEQLGLQRLEARLGYPPISFKLVLVRPTRHYLREHLPAEDVTPPDGLAESLVASHIHCSPRLTAGFLPPVLQRLRRQVAADPAGLTPAEQQALATAAPWSLTAFDRAITAPRWGYGSVEAYYAAAEAAWNAIWSAPESPRVIEEATNAYGDALASPHVGDTY